MDIRPSTVVHRNRTSPFNKNKQVRDNVNLNDLTRADSKDIKPRCKSRNNNLRERGKLIREDLEWFNSNASTEQYSDEFG